MDARQIEETELRKVIGRKPSAARVAFVMQALSSKWEGTQALAIKALGAWGGRTNVEVIRQFLEAAFDREAGWAIRKVAITTLAEIVSPDDAEWVDAMWLARKSGFERHELRPLMDRFPSLARPFPW
jgi:hypothetical protein